MENKKLGQESAFPIMREFQGPAKTYRITDVEYGMSKRYVTAKDILCGLVSNDKYSAYLQLERNLYVKEGARALLVSEALLLADELLKQEDL